jgi:hypothetical protein
MGEGIVLDIIGEEGLRGEGSRLGGSRGSEMIGGEGGGGGRKRERANGFSILVLFQVSTCNHPIL